MANRTGPNRFGPGFPAELVINTASFLDLRSLGAMSCADKALREVIRKVPLLYIRVQAKLTDWNFENPPGLSGKPETNARFVSLSKEFTLRLQLRRYDPVRTELSTPDTWDYAKSLPPLTSLQLLADSGTRTLQNLSKRNVETLNFLLQRALGPEPWNANHAAAMDTHAALLRALGESIFKNPKQAGIQELIEFVAKSVRDFIHQCLSQNLELIDKAKLHLLVGEWLRTFAQAENWDQKKIRETCKLGYSHFDLLDPGEWQQIFDLATSPDLKELSYLDLTNLDELKPDFGKEEPAPGSVEAKRKMLEKMPIWEAMDTLAKNFDEMLGDLSAASGQTLESLLQRASYTARWGQDLTVIIDAHTKLLGSMCPVLWAASHDERKKLLVAFGQKLDSGLSSLMRILSHTAARLREDQRHALRLMTGERVRTRILMLPSSKQTEKHINSRFGKCLGNPDLIDTASWEEILRLALSRRDEPLSCLDLKNQKESASSSSTSDAKSKPKKKALRNSAKFKLPGKKDKEEKKSDQRRPLERAATVGSTKAQDKENESEDEVENEAEDSTREKTWLDNRDASGNRYNKDHENRTVS